MVAMNSEEAPPAPTGYNCSLEMTAEAQLSSIQGFQRLPRKVLIH